MIIYNTDGVKIMDAVLTSNGKHYSELTTDNIQLQWVNDTEIVIPIGSYVVYNGQKYILFKEYRPEFGDNGFKYSVILYEEWMILEHTPLLFNTRDSDGNAISESEWTITDSPENILNYILDKIKEALPTADGEIAWSVTVSGDMPASITVSFSNVDILSGLSEVANQCSDINAEWHIKYDTRDVYFGKCISIDDGDNVILKVGDNIQEPKISTTSDKYYNRFIVKGSTRNIAKKAASGERVSTGVRLTLNKTNYPNGYIDTRRSTSEPVQTKVLVFDDIYPSLTLYVYNVRERQRYLLDDDDKKVIDCYDGNGNPVYKKYSIWYVRLAYYTTALDSTKSVLCTTVDNEVTHYWYNFETTDDMLISGKTLSISFEINDDGTHCALAGREFELTYHKVAETFTANESTADTGVSVLAGDYEIVYDKDSDDLIIPTTSTLGIVPWGEQLPSMISDTAILFNIIMPDEFYTSAQDKLATSAIDEITDEHDDKTSYEFNSDPSSFEKTDAPSLYVGKAITYNDGNGFTLATRVLKLTENIDFPQVKDITVSNGNAKGNIESIKEDVKNVTGRVNSVVIGSADSSKAYFKALKNKLSKIYDDTAEGVINFLNSIEIAGKKIESLFLSKTKEDSTEYLLKLLGGVITNQITSGGTDDNKFIQNEQGFRLAIDNTGHSVLEVDDIIARRKFTARVLEIQHEMFIRGDLNLTNANGTIIRVVPCNATINENTYAVEIHNGGVVIFAVPTSDGKFATVSLETFADGTTSFRALGDTKGYCNSLYSNYNAYKLYFLRTDKTKSVKDYWTAGMMAKVQEFNVEKDVDKNGTAANRTWARLVIAHGIEKLEDDEYYNYIVVSNEKDANNAPVQLTFMSEYSSLIKSAWSFDDALSNDVPSVDDDVIQWGAVDDEGGNLAQFQGLTKLSSKANGLGGLYVYQKMGTTKTTALEQFEKNDAPVKLTPGGVRIEADSLVLKTHNERGETTGTTTVKLWMGLWVSGKFYEYGSEVTYEGQLYSVTSKTGTSDPSVSPDKSSDWTKEVSAATIGVNENSTFYQVSTSGSDIPTGEWSTTIPTTPQGSYLWTKLYVKYSDGTEVVSYSVGYSGVDGKTIGIDTQTVEYQLSDSGYSTPTGEWSTTVPKAKQGSYLWTRTTVTYKDTNKVVSYSVSYTGIDGVSIKSTSTTYATSKTPAQPGDNMFIYTTLPDTSLGDYIWTKTSVIYSDGKGTVTYAVSRIGTDGSKGDDGTDGSSTHFAYATGLNGENFSTTNFDGATYLGTYTDRVVDDSTDYKSYVWTKLKGDDGTSLTIKSKSITYAISTSGTTPPTGGWSATFPTTLTKGDYLWIKTYILYSDDNSTTSYTVSYQGVDGTSIKIKGTLASTSLLPTSGAEMGDCYIIDGDLWVYTGSTEEGSVNGFTNSGKIKGDKGDSGTDALNFTMSPSTIIVDEYDTNPDAATSEIGLRGLPATVTIGCIVGTSTYTDNIVISDIVCDGIVCVKDNGVLASNNVLTISKIFGTVSDTEGTITFNVKRGTDEAQNLSVKVYVNRVSTLELKMKNDILTLKSEKETYALKNEVVSNTTYNSFLQTNSESLTSIKSAMTNLSSGTKNLFGFAKSVNWSNNIPAIQYYGIECVYAEGSTLGRIFNLGFNGEGGDFVVSGKIASLNGTIKEVNINLCDVNATEGVVSNIKQADGSKSSWTDFCLHFKNVNSYISKESTYNGFLDVEPTDTTNINDRIFIAFLKVERGNINSDFCISEEDLNNTGDTSCVTDWTMKGLAKDTTIKNINGKDCNVYITNTVPATGDYIDCMSKAVTLNDDTCYTLSFWAKGDRAGNKIISFLYPLICAGNSIYETADSNGEQSQMCCDDGHTETILTDSWKHYYIHFYTHGISGAKYCIPFRLPYTDINAISDVYICNVELYEGYIYDGNFDAIQVRQTRSEIKQTATEISEYITDNLYTTGIDIKNHTMQVYADNLYVSSSDKRKFLEIDSTTGKIKANCIYFYGQEIGFNDKLYIDKDGNLVTNGSLKATNATISGTINATNGMIGYFRISGGAIYGYDIVTDANGNQKEVQKGVYISKDIIIFNDPESTERQATFGSDTYYGISMLSRLTDTKTDMLPKYGTYYNIANSTGGNFAFAGRGNGSLDGFVDGFALSKITATDNTVMNVLCGVFSPLNSNKLLLKATVNDCQFILPSLEALRQSIGVGDDTSFSFTLRVMADFNTNEFTLWGKTDQAGNYPVITDWNQTYRRYYDFCSCDTLLIELVYDKDTTETINGYSAKYSARVISIESASLR